MSRPFQRDQDASEAVSKAGSSLRPSAKMSEERNGLPIIAFRDRQSFERWLEAQTGTSRGVWIKLAKVRSGVAGISKSEAIDAALCHGWIDGQLDQYDEKHFLTRFTPRKPRSRWSQVNCKRAVELLEEGRVKPSGAAQIEAAKADGRWAAAYAPASTAQVPADFQSALDQNAKAAAFFATLVGANRYALLYRIEALRTPEARARKIETFIAMLERHETLRR